VSWAYIAAFDPEPISKAVAFVGLVVVIAVDTAHDALIDLRAKTARRLLESIDLEERNQAVRYHLLQEVRSAEAMSASTSE
jgi:hypothetical protein